MPQEAFDAFVKLGFQDEIVTQECIRNASSPALVETIDIAFVRVTSMTYPGKRPILHKYLNLPTLIDMVIDPKIIFIYKFTSAFMELRLLNAHVLYLGRAN